MTKKVDNLQEIELAYRSTEISVNALAKRFDVSEPTLRRTIKKQGWVRCAPEKKRRIVADAMAGVTKGLTNDEVRQNQELEASQDIEDMRLGLKGARSILQATVSGIADAVDPKDLKILSECVKLNVETIRKIRGLDEPDDPQKGQTGVLVVQAQQTINEWEAIG